MGINKSTILIKTIINASSERVWKAWTDASLIMNWFGSDPKGTVLMAKLDVQPGGYFEVRFQDSDGTEHSCFGIYNEVREFNQLSFSWNWKSEPGVESFIELSLVAEGNSTRMQLEHSNLGIGSKHDYIKGWQSTFAKLDGLLNASV
ncbi:MAG: SRPBCC domain-containing protein [Bacteroidota bacterium]